VLNCRLLVVRRCRELPRDLTEQSNAAGRQPSNHPTTYLIFFSTSEGIPFLFTMNEVVLYRT
jgi:hypothetical protein